METVLNDSSYELITWQVLIIISIGIWVYSLIDILKNSFEKNNKIIWFVVILLVPVFGPTLYIFIERNKKNILN